MEWTRRNEDKPHRCPGCHGIALRAWSDRGYGPRTVLCCPRQCGLQWRAGVRARDKRGWRRALDTRTPWLWAGCVYRD